MKQTNTNGMLLLVMGMLVLYLLFSGTEGAVPVDYGTGNTINSYNRYHQETNNTSIDVCFGYCP